MDSAGQYSAEWGAWHDQRVADLATPFGWLSLTDLRWLTPGDPVRLDDGPGAFTLLDADSGWVDFRLDADASVGPTSAALELMSAPSSAAEVRTDSTVFQARVSEGKSLNWLVFNNSVVELLNRDGRVGIRRRDSKAPLLGQFIDIPTFALDTHWVVVGTFQAFDQPAKRRIATAWPGLEINETLVGMVYFTIAGQQYALCASGSLTNGLYVNFYDETNGVSTPPWRRLDLGLPDAQGGIILDFNRTVDYPMAFTPYATCPAPVPENVLPMAVTAGERRPNQTLSESGVNTPLLILETSDGLLLDPVISDFTDHGVEVTRVAVYQGEAIPPLVGFKGLIVIGFGAQDSPVPNFVENTLDSIADALAARIPVAALGNASAALALLSSPGWQSSMSSGEVSVPLDKLNAPIDGNEEIGSNALLITVSEDVARDPLFRDMVTWSAEGTSYISVREVAATVPPGSSVKGDTHPVVVAWHKLVERFSRMVHARD